MHLFGVPIFSSVQLKVRTCDRHNCKSFHSRKSLENALMYVKRYNPTDKEYLEIVISSDCGGRLFFSYTPGHHQIYLERGDTWYEVPEVLALFDKAKTEWLNSHQRGLKRKLDDVY